MLLIFPYSAQILLENALLCRQNARLKNRLLCSKFCRQNLSKPSVVAKQANTTKVKNKFLNGKKTFKRILSCLFDGRGKVQFRRKNLGDKVQAKSSNLPRRFCSNSVGTPLEFAAFRSGFDAKYSRASAFWFFLSTVMVFTAFRTHFARKNTSIFMPIGNLSRRKK